jgi:hypothetical protein
MAKQKYPLVIALLFSIIFNADAYTERNLLQKSISFDKLKESLILNQKWVPYPDYNDRKGWNTLFNEYSDGFIKKGEEKLNYQWQVVKATDYIEFEKSGSRDIMQKPFNENNNALSALILAELAEGKGRFLDQIINGVFYNCEITSWVLSAHLSAQHSKHSLPDYKEHVIDLTAGEVGSLLSWTYYFFNKEFDKVNPVISERLRHVLQERILDTYINETRFWWMHSDLKPGETVNNWNPWCNFNALQCFLLLENDRDILSKAVYKTMVSVDKFINYNHEDGACEEGPSYWGHAAGKMYDYLQLLYDGTNGKVNIFDEAIIRNLGEYISRSYVGDGWVVNFADASAKGGGNGQLIYRYGKAVDSKEMMEYASFLVNRTKDNPDFTNWGTDLFRGFQTLRFSPELSKIPPMHENPPYNWYPETEFCYISNKANWFLATKGGNNNESHNHNDIGTFSLYINSIPVFIDAGVGTYTRQTFSNERYTIWTMQSDYHNLPVINGFSQKNGSQYKASDIVFNQKKKQLSLNIAKAYPEESAIDKWNRTYALSDRNLKIIDSFSINEIKGDNIVNFLSWGNINISQPGVVNIEVQGEKIKLLYNKNLFEPGIETIKLDDPRLSGVWGKEIYRISLKAKEKSKSGKYEFTITNVN